MNITISQEERSKLPHEGEHLVLALILTTGEVRFCTADEMLYRGHLEWLKRDNISIEDTMAGFSMIIKHRLVTHMFTASRLNRHPSGQLDPSIARQLKSLLSFSEHARIW